ncbi:MAG: class I SAM-dependent methyltransferase [Snowella sp.]|nr:class I SAM-dependent methyltransferase [Snowella sp.]
MNNDPKTFTPEEITERISCVKHWYHQIDLGSGIVTPGVHNSADGLKTLDSLGLPSDCQSLRVLDIGCRDGFFAFTMEKRGAEVIGIDYAKPDVTGFSVASTILGSNVTYLVENVYNLDPEKYGVFDIVLFLGVLYHLRNPLLALDQIRKVTKPNGLLFLESHITTHAALSSLDIPAWEFYPRDSLYNDATNKWGPNIVGLKAAVEEAQFNIKNSVVEGERAYVAAQATSDAKQEYFRQLDTSIGVFGV